MLRSFRFLALASACLASLILCACGSTASPKPAASGNSASTAFVGYDWLVVAISHDGTTTSIPARLNVGMKFARNGRFAAEDSVNSYGGTFRTTPSGFATNNLAGTLVGYAGHDPAVLLSQSAISALASGDATASVTGDRLVVRLASYTLTCQRDGPAT